MGTVGSGPLKLASYKGRFPVPEAFITMGKVQQSLDSILGVWCVIRYVCQGCISDQCLVCNPAEVISVACNRLSGVGGVDPEDQWQSSVFCSVAYICM